MNTLVVYMLCAKVNFLTLVMPDKVLVFKPTPQAYIKIVQITKGEFNTFKFNSDNFNNGQCT